MTGSESVRRVVLYVRAIGSNTPRGWLNIAVFSNTGGIKLEEGKDYLDTQAYPEGSNYRPEP